MSISETFDKSKISEIKVSAYGRNKAIDIARGIGILLVIYGHTVEIGFIARPDGKFIKEAFEQWQFIYSFHMPLFYFISGMSASVTKHKDKNKLWNSVCHLLILAASIHIISFIPSILATAAGLPASHFTPWSLQSLLVGNGLVPISIWFLVSLATVQICFYAFYYGNIFSKSSVAIICMVSLALEQDWPVQNYFQIKSLLPGLIFFLAGFCGYSIYALRLNGECWELSLPRYSRQ